MFNRKGYKTILGYSRYEVNENGDGFIIGTDEAIKWHKSNGYLFSKLIDDNGIRKSIGKHRAVALAFIPQPNVNSKLTVNHIDGNKSNNYVSNLEWATYSENTKHGYLMNLRNDNIPVIVTNLETDESVTYHTKRHCIDSLGISFKLLNVIQCNGGFYNNHKFEFIYNEVNFNSKQELYPTGIAARHIKTKQVFVTENLSQLSSITGIHSKVLKRILLKKRFTYPVKGFDIRTNLHELNWPEYSEEEIEAFCDETFIHQPVYIEYIDGKIQLVGSVKKASIITGINERSIRTELNKNRFYHGKWKFHKYERNFNYNA